MLNFNRVGEIVCYAMLNFLPYLFAALYPFRYQFRYSKKIMALFIFIITLVQVEIGLLDVLWPDINKTLLNLVSTIVYFVFYFWAVKAHLGKTLFTLLMLSGIANFIVVCSKCLEGYFFPALARQPFRWSYSVMMLLVQLFILVPLFFYIRNIYTNAIEKETNPVLWRYLWLVPATFYLLGHYHLYGNTKTSTEIALQPENTVFLLFINLGAMLIYHMVVCLINEYHKNSGLEMQNHLLEIQKLQYEKLTERIAEARRARHDLEHHIAIMTGYLKGNQLDKLSDYLEGYRKALPDDSDILFCQNTAVNLLMLYFSQQAKEREIDFSVHMDIPKQISIGENELAVLLGNLLENAVTACSNQTKGERRITVCGKVNEESLLFTIDNTFEGEIKRGKDGIFLSTKHGGAGIGIESVKQIVLRHDGMFEFEQRDGIFYVSILLKLS